MNWIELNTQTSLSRAKQNEIHTLLIRDHDSEDIINFEWKSISWSNILFPLFR